ncbi:ribbon-helix-helix domain-containing protein [Leptolyngbya sp. CCNP1308]|uniref:ribbon-helix-helix domain-containing protein n=1 Tax=Leptolyngbya sp. CCNP1308 TaxID=3110255 RepID=UPI002B20B28B|nr:ribbon-helix-helix domain-containing protein [Leptolyngbya sp. CCNP1308]MEA5449455.1 ribbon-helix-helix domain-containing protein [Leptolyngbya sp. CCNP1308]
MRLALVAGRVPQSYVDQLDKIGAETGKCQSELVRDAIAAYLDKTEPEAVEKMSRCVAQLEKQVKALILTQTS